MIEPKTFRISKERKELIAKYANISVNIYGILSVDEFVEVFNHYENQVKTTADEAELALLRYAKQFSNEAEYSIKNSIISGPEFQPCFDTYKEDVKNFRAAQKGKPRYLPDKDEFLRYHDCIYREPEKPYADLKAFIVKNKLTKKKADGIINADDGDLIDLHELIQSSVLSASDEIEFFTERGYSFKNIDILNEFMQQVMNVHNNTRMFENNGHTPDEIFEKYERPKLKPLPQTPFVFGSQSHIKILPSRNGACPCGSGKKYKRCCGKEQKS